MKKAILSLLTIGGFCAMSFAQQIDALQVFMKPVDANGETLQTRDRAVLTDPATNLFVTYAVKVSGDVAKIHVKLGTTEGGSEKVNYTVNADGSNLPQGVSVRNQEGVYYIDLGYFNGIQQYYAEAVAEASNGSLSPAAEQSTLN